jgi:hypothetical protein
VDVPPTRKDLMADIRWSRKTIAIPDMAVRTPRAHEAAVPNSMLKVRVMKAVVYDEGIFHGETPVGQG